MYVRVAASVSQQHSRWCCVDVLPILTLRFAWWMTGRDRDVVDVLAMRGLFAGHVILNSSDARISRLNRAYSDLTGLYSN